MMTLTLKLANTSAIDQINKFCLVNSVDAKCQYSKLTGKVIYAFSDIYPKGLEKQEVEYEEIQNRL